MEAVSGKLKSVWTLAERGGRMYRTRIGIAWDAGDGTLTARLDALPISGRLVIGEWVAGAEIGAAEPARSGTRAPSGAKEVAP